MRYMNISIKNNKIIILATNNQDTEKIKETLRKKGIQLTIEYNGICG